MVRPAEQCGYRNGGYIYYSISRIYNGRFAKVCYGSNIRIV